MKFNLSQKLKNLLASIGVRGDMRPQPAFPSILPSEYESVWEEYLLSRTVRDLFSTYDKLEAIYYTCMGFVSLMEDMYTELDKQKTDESYTLYDPRPYYDKLSSWMRTTRLNQGIRLNKHTFYITYNNISILRAIHDITCTGILEYKMNGRDKLAAHLHKTKNVFGFRIPKELIDEKGSYLLADAQAKNSKGWVEVDTRLPGLKVKVARAKFNTLMIKYQFTVPVILFVGSTAGSYVKRALNAKHKRLITI